MKRINTDIKPTDGKRPCPIATETTEPRVINYWEIVPQDVTIPILQRSIERFEQYTGTYDYQQLLNFRHVSQQFREIVDTIITQGLLLPRLIEKYYNNNPETNPLIPFNKQFGDLCFINNIVDSLWMNILSKQYITNPENKNLRNKSCYNTCELYIDKFNETIYNSKLKWALYSFPIEDINKIPSLEAKMLAKKLLFLNDKQFFNSIRELCTKNYVRFKPFSFENIFLFEKYHKIFQLIKFMKDNLSIEIFEKKIQSLIMTAYEDGEGWEGHNSWLVFFCDLLNTGEYSKVFSNDKIRKQIQLVHKIFQETNESEKLFNCFGIGITKLLYSTYDVNDEKVLSALKNCEENQQYILNILHSIYEFINNSETQTIVEKFENTDKIFSNIAAPLSIIIFTAEFKSITEIDRNLIIKRAIQIIYKLNDFGLINIDSNAHERLKEKNERVSELLKNESAIAFPWIFS